MNGDEVAVADETRSGDIGPELLGGRLDRRGLLTLHRLSAVLGVAVIAAAMAVPALLPFETVGLAWGVLIVIGLGLLILQVASLAYRRRVEAATSEGPVLERPDMDRLDFDRPWREVEDDR